MLVLTRKSAQKIHVGENITITVLRIKGGAVKLGIDAPRDVRVLRSELPVLEFSEQGDDVAEGEPSAATLETQACESPVGDDAESPAPTVHRLVAPERRRNMVANEGGPAAEKTSLRAMVAATRRRTCVTV